MPHAGLSYLLGPAGLITLFTLAGQAIAFITQVVAAALFGAGASMDAFLAATAVPQYLGAVLLSSLGVVFVPVFMGYVSRGQRDEAWAIASSIINLSLLAFGTLMILGMLIPGVVLRLTAPGLPQAIHRLATQVAVITWPSILTTGLILLLTGIYQCQSRFAWPAAVPVLGAIASLGLMVMLASAWGIVALAIATTTGLVLQAALLLPILLRRGRYHLIVNWRHPGVLKVLLLLAPLALSNAVAKSTTLVERFLASSMGEGTISHLGYAFRLQSLLTVLIASGITTVVFPRMAVNVAGNDLTGLRRTLSASLRFMWLAVAPAMTLGIALALPLVTVVFQRGRFNAGDAAAVATLLRVYLLSLAAGCLGGITGRGFYALQDIRTFAVLSSVESVAYVLYTSLLARRLGALGVALGYVILFNVSLVWTVLVLRYKTGNTGGRTVIGSFVRSGFAAMVGGGLAFVAISVLPLEPIYALIIGGGGGIVAYGFVLYLLGAEEINVILDVVLGHRR